jgi:hypothetical protein
VDGRGNKNETEAKNMDICNETRIKTSAINGIRIKTSNKTMGRVSEEEITSRRVRERRAKHLLAIGSNTYYRAQLITSKERRGCIGHDMMKRRRRNEGDS